MKGKKNAPLTAATANEANGSGLLCAACDPIFEYSTYSSSGQELLSTYLGRGSANSVSTPDLCSVLHCSVRQLRDLVSEARKHGELILSAPGGGYFLPADGQSGTAELLFTYRLGRAKAVSLLAALSPIRDELSRRGAFCEPLPGQEKIEGTS